MPHARRQGQPFGFSLRNAFVASESLTILTSLAETKAQPVNEYHFDHVKLANQRNLRAAALSFEKASAAKRVGRWGADTNAPTPLELARPRPWRTSAASRLCLAAHRLGTAT